MSVRRVILSRPEMPFLRQQRLALAAIGLAPAVLCAQSSSTRPDFSPIRFEEKPATHAVDDIPKHITILAHDLAWLSLGASVRWREEFNHDYQFSADSANQGQFSVSRTLINGDLHIGRATSAYLRGFAEFRDAQGFNRNLPGGVRTTEEDRHDWQNAFVETGWSSILAIRFGRQDVALGKERLVGISDWTNSRRSFQGLRVLTSVGGLAVDLLDARVMIVRSNLPNRPDSTTRFRYAAIGSAHDAAAARTLRPMAWQIYILQNDAVLGARNARSTYGARAQWKAPIFGQSGAQLSYDFEGAVQRGRQDVRDVRAWFVANDVQLTFRKAPWAPTVIVGYDRASGDKDAADGHAETFTALYASAHSYGGIADVFGRGNLAEVRTGASVEPTAWLGVQLVSRAFSRVELGDGVYSKQNARFRAPSNSTARNVGTETDLAANVKIGRHLRVQGGLAEIDPGAFLRLTPGGAHAQHFAFVGSTLTY
jgi:hypothetical protein